jgi:hypothetical protein
MIIFCITDWQMARTAHSSIDQQHTAQASSNIMYDAQSVCLLYHDIQRNKFL